MFFLRTLVVGLLLTASACGQGWSYNYGPTGKPNPVTHPQETYRYYDSQIPKPTGTLFGFTVLERSPGPAYVTDYTWGTSSNTWIKKYDPHRMGSDLPMKSQWMHVEQRPWWKFW